MGIGEKDNHNGRIPDGAKSLVETNMYYHFGEPKVFKATNELDPYKPIIVDLFCGLGGLSLGFEMAGFQTVLGVDIHKPSLETFKHSHPTAVTILGDISLIVSLENSENENLITEELKKKISDRKVDVLMAGIPCQGFSLSNRKRDVLDERNYLFVYFVRMVELLKPNFILLENVSGLKSMGKGQFVSAIEECIKNVDGGYENITHNLLNAADYGVPQFRKRVIFLASLPHYKIIWPVKYFNGKTKPFKTVGDAISDLPPLNAGEESYAYLPNNELSEYQKSMKGDNSQLLNHRSPKHPPSTVKKIGDTTPGKPIYPKYTQRIRLNLKQPSPTQVSGGIRPQYQFGHPTDARGLTVRERCRIQSIPDWVNIHGGTVQGRVQTGNAVPPLLAKAVAHNIFLELIKEPFVEEVAKWGKKNSRDFLWRKQSAKPYEILISEMMLRKTRAENIVETYQKFIVSYPNPIKLSEASEKDIESLIKPLGLHKQRAKALVFLGKTLVNLHGGKVPKNVSQLESIPHIGRYIANATIMFGYGIKKPIVDENVQRVFSRFFGILKAKEIHKADYLWELADSLIPEKSFKKFAWAFLDFAALICRAKNPLHNECPVKNLCLNQKGILRNV